MADNFVDTPMSDMFCKTETPDGGPGTYNGLDGTPWSEWKRTASPNGVREKVLDGNVKEVSGEPDQF